MKKIQTREEIEKRNKRNQLIIGIILVGLMLLSTGGYAIMSNEGSSSSGFIKYKGIKFYNDGGYWKFIYNNNQFITQYNPKETENISVNTNIDLSKYSNSIVYFVTETGEPNNEIYRNIAAFILKQNGACLNGINCSANVPVKDCGNDNIIIVKEPLENEKEEVIQDRNCVFIKANYENQTKFADAFLFKLLGI